MRRKVNARAAVLHGMIGDLSHNRHKEDTISKYWDIPRTVSHNCLFNFILGIRGAGKTYGLLALAERDES